MTSQFAGIGSPADGGNALSIRGLSALLVRAHRSLPAAIIPNSVTSQPVATPLFLKRRIHQQIDGRYWPVAGHEALAEIAQKIVGGGLRLRGHEVTARLRELGFHLETWEFSENFGHLR